MRGHAAPQTPPPRETAAKTHRFPPFHLLVLSPQALLDDHRLLVEPACGAALALLYSERQRAAVASFDPLVVVVCGGSGVNWEIMQQWRAQFLSD